MKSQPEQRFGLALELLQEGHDLYCSHLPGLPCVEVVTELDHQATERVDQYSSGKRATLILLQQGQDRGKGAHYAEESRQFAFVFLLSRHLFVCPECHQCAFVDVDDKLQLLGHFKSRSFLLPNRLVNRLELAKQIPKLARHR